MTAVQLKRFRPTSPGVRHKVVVRGERRGPQEVPKALRVSKSKSGGRNNTGHISAFHRGGGSRLLIRSVTPQVLATWNQAEVVAIQVDPNRSAPLARVRKPGSSTSPTKATNSSKSWSNHDHAYVIAGKGMTVGTVLHAGPHAPFDTHSRLPRGQIPRGTRVYDVEVVPGRGGQRVKSAGTFAERIAVDPVTSRIKLRRPSKGERWFSDLCTACIGQVAGEDHMLKVAGKAGWSRRRGIRPTVRGVAMNPIDHPHGGRTSGGRHDVTPWARIAKGKPTRSPRKPSVFVVMKPKG